MFRSLPFVVTSIQTYVLQNPLWGKPARPPKHLTAGCGGSVLFANDALLLIGHGSTRVLDPDAALRLHAEALRRMAVFAQVEVALLNGTPSVEAALARIEAPAIRVVPFFMEDGYFTRVAVPRALGGRAVHLCPPVGVHVGMAGLIERHALAGCGELSAPSRHAAVVVAGHGSASAPGKVLALHVHAARVAATELFARVEPTCLEEAPFLADTLQALRAHPVVVVGFFANRGVHVREDVPALIEAEQAMRRSESAGDAACPVRFHGCVTDDPMMVRIILDQASQNATQQPAGEP
jgi:sirohydrochlorin cobaltochelatase